MSVGVAASKYFLPFEHRLTAKAHLRLTRIVRTIAAAAGVGLLMPVLFSGTLGDLGWSEVTWIVAAILTAKVPLAIVHVAFPPQCRHCDGILAIKKASFVVPKLRDGQMVEHEFRYWCSACKSSECFPGTWIDKLFSFPSSSNSDTPPDPSVGE
ncbi:hypothetical protein [Stieleria mannarensis]|uniref:hypothetical protein n=1 Tax=Stieleria mannarensis TaxID=2755585 RepID=UPI0016046018|nr:hypothetical protein [Rhodopirellula sp. JC639]